MRAIVLLLLAACASSPREAVPAAPPAMPEARVTPTPALNPVGEFEWASALADGTPLVTAAKQGDGWIVLFHVTADTTCADAAARAPRSTTPAAFSSPPRCEPTRRAGSAPSTAMGTIGAFARIAASTNPPRPKRRSR